MFSSFSGPWSQLDSGLQIHSLPLTTGREYDRDASVGHDYCKDRAQGIQVGLHDAWHGIGREDIANVCGTGVDDCDRIDARGKRRKLGQDQIAEN